MTAHWLLTNKLKENKITKKQKSSSIRSKDRDVQRIKLRYKIIVRINTDMYSKHPRCFGTSKALCNLKCDKCFNLSFASHPKAEFWSDENEVSPRSVFRSGRGLYKFKCNECNHTFQSLLHSIINGAWCPYCINRKLCIEEDCKKCHKASFASHPRAKYWSKRNILSPREVSRCSNSKYWFICNKCHHEFDLKLNDCTLRNYWCPYCAGKRLCPDHDNCDVCFDRSFASHPRANCWSDTNNVDPRDVMKNTHKEYDFWCSKCKHIFSMRLDSVVKGHWCSYCNGDALCEDNECDFCHDVSFASHPRADCWSPENELTARQVRKNSNKKHLLDCKGCFHTFEGILCNIVLNGAWCPYCSNPTRKLCEDDECQHCFDNAFASHPRSKNWHPSNDTTPRMTFKNSHVKRMFTCDEGHKFVTSPNHIVSCNNWCPVCKNKTERKLYEWLLKTYPKYTITREQKFDWCKNPATDRKLPYDFYIVELGILIELDGPQHFKQIHNWQSPEEVRAKDKYKEIRATSNDLSMIRLLQEDVLGDRNRWDSNLRRVINEIDREDELEESIYSIYEDNVECSSYELVLNEDA
jgi:hypothetical protein